MKTPAEIVIDRIGVKTIMKVCGLKTTIQILRWNYSKEKGGHEGRVPSRHHAALLSYAKNHGIPLRLSELNPDLAEAAQ